MAKKTDIVQRQNNDLQVSNPRELLIRWHSLMLI